MFIWDFMVEVVLGQIVDWIYSQTVGFLGEFFMLMENMGAELFELPWVQSVVLLFLQLAWALYVVGIVVAGFECAIEYQSGRGSIKETALNVIKGFMATGLFSIVPIELYKLSISLQGSFTAGITDLGKSFGEVASEIIISLQDAGNLEQAMLSSVFGGIQSINSPIFMIFILVMMGYAVIKVFFANLKRGGILLIQIAIGSLYLFGIPRGYHDGFVSWSKQVVGLCLAAFLQAIVLIAGLMVLNEKALLGLGLMLSAGEIPRIAGQFGLDTSARANLAGTVQTAHTAISMTRTVMQAVAK